MSVILLDKDEYDDIVSRIKSLEDDVFGDEDDEEESEDEPKSPEFPE